ncbi:MAG: hypothetical protein KGS60_08905 [Verrucomicrobia bacterium]|nr:hypothetical protein [Verrucomicrobiota bacterium]
MTIEILQHLLERRLQIIADHAFRDRDPEGHLHQLKEVSEGIVSAHEQLRPDIDARLHHYLSQASYSKALEHLKAPQKKGEDAK